MKKIISLLLAFLLIFSSFNVFAKENRVIRAEAKIIGTLEVDIFYSTNGEVDHSDPRILAAAAEAKTKILSGETDIDISKYGFTYEEARAVFSRLFYGAPELFFLARTYSIGYGFNNKMEELIVYYKFEEDEISALQKEFYDYLDEVIALMPSGLSDLEKLIFLYDYVTSAYDYDYSYEIYDAYTMIKNGKGVCQGYTNLMGAFLNRLGIDNDFAQSDSLYHIWNTVKINGKWYNFDATWDSGDGVSSKDWFLKSDDAFNRDVDIQLYPCTDKTYDGNWFITSIPGMVGFSGGRVYYNDGAAVKSALIDGTDIQTEITLSEKDWDVGGSFAVITNGVLYYNNNRTIRARELSTGRDVAIGSVNVNDWVRGFGWSRNNDGFGYGIWAPNGNGSYSSARSNGFYPFATFPPVSPKLGDVNGDTYVDTQDAIVILRYVAGYAPAPFIIDNANVNGDSAVDTLDAIAILRYVAGY